VSRANANLDAGGAKAEPSDRRRTEAETLGGRLAEAVAEPEVVASVAENGLRDLASERDRLGLVRVAPGLAPIVGVSFFLAERAGHAFARDTRGDSPMNVLLAVERLFSLPMLEARWLAMPALERLVTIDPERTWQLLRRASREAPEWISVDALAHPFGRGILDEPFRWAELGQLVFAPSSWERRLVASTIATLPFVDRRAGRDAIIAERGLPLIESLIGDERPEVQKALAWALRSLTLVDRGAVEAFAEREAEHALATNDGYRAWVIRDVLSKLEPDLAARLRQRLASVHRRPGSPATSAASSIARSFVEAGGVPPLGGEHVERIPVGAR
jgi:hypothetical protein